MQPAMESMSEDATFASTIKDYIRHNIMVQCIYVDLPKELMALYGPGLLKLAKISSPLDKVWDDEESQGEALTD